MKKLRPVFPVLLFLLSLQAHAELLVCPRMPVATATANNWVSAISAGGATTLSQPAFSNLSGTATDAQLATSYLKADGTRGLSGNWAAGLFSISSQGLTTTTNIGIGQAANGTVKADIRGVVPSASATEYGIFDRPTATTTATTAFNGIATSVTTGAAVTLADLYNVHVNDATVGASGTLTRQYGVLIDNLAAAGTNYGIAQNGTSVLNFFLGKVGIGTSAPGRKFDVSDSSTDVAKITTSSVSDSTLLALQGGSGTRMRFLPTGGSSNYNWQIAAQTNVNNALEITPSTATGGSTFSTPIMIFDGANARVGINKNAPTTALDVTGVILGTNLTVDGVKTPTTGSTFVNSAVPGSISGTSNLVVGNAGSTLTSGASNILIGPMAGSSVSTAGQNVVIGNNSDSGNVSGVTVMGYGAATLGGFSVVLGDNAANGTGVASITIGNNSYSGSTGSSNNVFGYAAGELLTSGSANIIMGREGGDTYPAASSNSFVAGSSNYPINNVYFGKGYVAASPTTAIVNGTGGSGSNVAGGALHVAGGAGTGTAAGGDIVLRVTPAGSSGSSANPLVTALTIDANTALPKLPVRGAASTPTCGATQNGALALTSGYILCVCNSTSWVRTSDGLVACTF